MFLRNLFSASNVTLLGIKKIHRKIVCKGIIALVSFRLKVNTMIIVTVISVSIREPPFSDPVVISPMQTGRILEGLQCQCFPFLIDCSCDSSPNQAQFCPREPRQRVKSFSDILFQQF